MNIENKNIAHNQTLFVYTRLKKAQRNICFDTKFRRICWFDDWWCTQQTKIESKLNKRKTQIVDK